MLAVQRAKDFRDMWTTDPSQGERLCYLDLGEGQESAFARTPKEYMIRKLEAMTKGRKVSWRRLTNEEKGGFEQDMKRSLKL